MSVPEINGKPAVKITVGVEEKIGLKNYSNVTLGPFVVERYIEDDDNILEAMRSTLHDTVEELLISEREALLELVKEK